MGTRKICANSGTSGRFIMNKTALPMYMLAISPQKSSGESTINSGPGL